MPQETKPIEAAADQEQSPCSPSVRTGRDFFFRIWDGQSMLCWGAATQTAFNVGCEKQQQPLMFRIFTNPDWIVMQATPWRDVEDKPIYEGDVLEFDPREWGGECRFVMQWSEGEWSHNGCHSDLSQWCRVIGNIHEQPDLIQTLCD